MFLQYDALWNPFGQWAFQYGRHIGNCAFKTDINFGSYYDLPNVEKKKNWEEAQVIGSFIDLYIMFMIIYYLSLFAKYFVETFPHSRTWFKGEGS